MINEINKLHHLLRVILYILTYFLYLLLIISTVNYDFDSHDCSDNHVWRLITFERCILTPLFSFISYVPKEKGPYL